MSTKTWLILKDGKYPVLEDSCSCYCLYGCYSSSSPRIFNSSDEALKEAKKLASKNIEDYTIFGSETITAVKTPDVDVIAVTAPAATV